MTSLAASSTHLPYPSLLCSWFSWFHWQFWFFLWWSRLINSATLAWKREMCKERYTVLSTRIVAGRAWLRSHTLGRAIFWLLTVRRPISVKCALVHAIMHMLKWKIPMMLRTGIYGPRINQHGQKLMDLQTRSYRGLTPSATSGTLITQPVRQRSAFIILPAETLRMQIFN